MIVGLRLTERIWFGVLIGLVFGYMAMLADTTQATGTCLNEAARTGPSATLPDCRAYELVTPADKSSAVQDMGNGNTAAIAAVDGERLALETQVTFGPRPQLGGSFSVFSRTASGWQIESVKPKDVGSTVYENEIFSPDLTEVGVRSETAYPSSSDLTYWVGAPGGPFAKIAETPREDQEKHGASFHDRLFGASADFSHVVFASTDHTLLPKEPTGTDEEAYDLYEWVSGQLRLVNVDSDGNLLGKCGAVLGAGYAESPDGVFGARYAQNAVSANGSKIFFTVPDVTNGSGGSQEGCYERDAAIGEKHAPRLYMSINETVGGQEVSRTVEVSVPASNEVHLSVEEEEMPVFYQAATANGSKVFFITDRALTQDAAKGHAHLYEYDTESEALKLISNTADEDSNNEPEQATSVFPSEDGSVIYFYTNELSRLYRYEDGAGPPQLIASMVGPGEGSLEGGGGGDEAPHSTPDGEFFVFVSTNVNGIHGEVEEPELRGAGHNEIYRYDHADGRVICVSCGSGDAPIGNAFEGTSKGTPGFLGDFATENESPERIVISTDGSKVFFDSTAALTPQVVGEGLANVYEWEADGTGSCTENLSCTFLISQGNSSESELIGASSDGSNVFFMTHAQLVPQDTDTSNDIYDARVDGGFLAPVESAACLGDTCLSQPLAPNDPTPAMSSFVGPGNPVLVPVTKKCAKGKVRRKEACVKKKRKAKKLARPKASKAKKLVRRVVRRDHGDSQ